MNASRVFVSHSSSDDGVPRRLRDLYELPGTPGRLLAAVTLGVAAGIPGPRTAILAEVKGHGRIR